MLICLPQEMVVVSTTRDPGVAGFCEADITHELMPTFPGATVVLVVLLVVVLDVVDVVVVAGAGAMVVVVEVVVVEVVVVEEVVDVVVDVVDVVVVASGVHCAKSESPPAGIDIEALSA